jgi:hypothetical protein
MVYILKHNPPTPVEVRMLGSWVPTPSQDMNICPRICVISRDSSVVIVTRLRAERPRNQRSVTVRTRDVSVNSIQSDFGAHPASYPVGTLGFPPGVQRLGWCLLKHSFTFALESKVLFLCQRLNTATSSPADDVHHYIIPQKLLDSIFNKLPVFMRQREKEKAVLYPVEVSPP